MTTTKKKAKKKAPTDRRIAPLARKLREGHKMDNEDVAIATSELAASMLLIHKQVTSERLAGYSKADEVKILPSLSSNIRKALEALGVSAHAEGEDDDL